MTAGNSSTISRTVRVEDAYAPPGGRVCGRDEILSSVSSCFSGHASSAVGIRMLREHQRLQAPAPPSFSSFFSDKLMEWRIPS